MTTQHGPMRSAGIRIVAGCTVAVLAVAAGCLLAPHGAVSPPPATPSTVSVAATREPIAESQQAAPSADEPRDDAACVIVTYRDIDSWDGVGTSLGGDTVLRPVPKGSTAAEYADALARSRDVALAEPDYLLKPADTVSYTATPNDVAFNEPLALTFGTGTSAVTVPYAKSWALHGDFSAHFDAVWPALGHAKATSDEVRVAVVDTGFFFEHPDARFANIQPAIDECASYYPALGRLTTDAIVAPVPEYTVPDSDPLAVVSHGTMTASQIGAAADNYEGSLGATYDTRVDIYKVQGIVAESGGGLRAGVAVIPESAIINAINDAVATAQRDDYRLVINISLVLVDSEADKLNALKAAILSARNAGVIVVGASGNEGGSSVYYPAACPGAVAVGASMPSTAGITRASYSNYGSAIDLVAPGTNIWGPAKPGVIFSQDFENPGYTWWTGTSMAAPYVSSAAALLLRIEPSLTATEVISYLTEGAVDLGTTGWDTKTGWGELDALRSYLLLATPRTTANVQPRYPLEARIEFTVSDRDSGSDVTTFYRLDGSSTLSGSTATFTSIGQHRLEFWSIDGAGVREATQTAYFEITLADTTPPITSSDATSTYRGTASIRLSAADNDPQSWGLESTHFMLDGHAEQTGTVVTTGATGEHSLAFWSVDRSGNVEVAKVVTFTVNPIETAVTLRRSASTIRRGSRVKLYGSLLPALKGDFVRIQVRSPGSQTWKYIGRGDWRVYRRKVTTVYSSGRGVYSPVSVALKVRGRYYFRAVFTADTLKLSRTTAISPVTSVYVR